MNVPQEPILKSENEGEYFFCTSRGWIGATHLYVLPSAWQRGIETEPPFQNPGSATELLICIALKLIIWSIISEIKRKLHFCRSPPFQCTWSNSPDHLLKLWYDEEEAKDHNNIRLWVAACLWFFEFLQAGEVTVRSEANSDAGVHLNFPNVAIDSKYNPFMIRIPIHTKGITKNDLCPMTVMPHTWPVRELSLGHCSSFRMGGISLVTDL